MNGTRRTLLLAVVVLAVAIAGCSAIGGGGNEVDVDPSNYSAESLQQEAQASMANVTSVTMEMGIESEVQGPMGAASSSIEAEAAANYETRRMHFESLDIERSTPQGSDSVSAEAYQVGDTMYVDAGAGWRSLSADGAAWSQGTAAQQTELLDDAEVSIEGAESVNGEDALVVSVEPSDAALAELAGSTSSSTALSAGSMEIQSATVTQYIAAEDPHYVLKSELDMVAVIQGNEIDQTITVTMDDHDETVTIDVPEEIQ